MTESDIYEAINNSEYALINSAEKIIRSHDINIDSDNKYRNNSGEIDYVDIMSTGWIEGENEKNGNLFHCVIECYRNSFPLVFFEDNNAYAKFEKSDDIKYVGSPLVLLSKESSYQNIIDYLKISTFHRYCKSKTFSKYCTFVKMTGVEGGYKTSKDLKIHNKIDNLINCIEYNMANVIETYNIEAGEFNAYDRFVFSPYYPILIVEQDLFSASQKDNESDILIEKAKWLNYRLPHLREGIKNNTFFQVEIVQKKYLDDFLKMIVNENIKMHSVFEKNIDELNHEAIKYLDEANDEGDYKVAVSKFIKNWHPY